MEFDVSDIKPTVLSLLFVFFAVLITVPVGKFVLNKWKVPGMSDLMNSV
jgi:hypothetical protein